MDYLLRNIPEDLWRKAKSKAALQGLNMKQLLILLLEAWLKAKIILKWLEVADHEGA